MHPDRLRVSAGPGALAVARYGHAERTVLLLHGFPLASSCWRDVAPVLVNAGWMVACPDLLGHGESDRPLDASLAPGAQAHWVLAAMDALGVQRAALVGHDLGGLVASMIAAHAPTRVSHLALVSPLVGHALPPSDVRVMQRETGRLALRLAGHLLGAAELIEPLLRARSHGPVSRRDLAAAVAPFVGREGVRQLLTLARALEPGPEAEFDPQRIEAPVLVFAGEHEPLIDTGAAGGERSALTDAELERVPGAGALAPIEAPLWLGTALAAFLSRNATPP